MTDANPERIRLLRLQADKCDERAETHDKIAASCRDVAEQLRKQADEEENK